MRLAAWVFQRPYSRLRTLSDAFYRSAAHRMCQHQGKGSAQGKQLERLLSEAFAYRLLARRIFLADEGTMFVADKNCWFGGLMRLERRTCVSRHVCVCVCAAHARTTPETFIWTSHAHSHRCRHGLQTQSCLSSPVLPLLSCFCRVAKKRPPCIFWITPRNTAFWTPETKKNKRAYLTYKLLPY